MPLETVTLPELPAPVRLARRRGARRFTLSVSQIDGAIRLTAPSGASYAATRAFLLENAGWITNATSQAAGPIQVSSGVAVPIFGVDRTIEPSAAWRGPVTLTDATVAVPGAPDQIARKLHVWLREEARTRLTEAAYRHASALGAKPNRITIRDTTSRWGSCTQTGNLSFCWRLVMAPPEVLDYVAAHEAAHLLEMNHGRRFWAHVDRLDPNWRPKRDWLKKNGAELHRYRLT